MKVDLTSLGEGFVLRPVDIKGELCYLVFPQHIGVKWNKDNLIFRSSVWNSNEELVSAGFRKFFNWGEQPDLAYTPFSTTANGGIHLLEKIDGSTLIVSKYNGQLITRTRGTISLDSMENGHELETLKHKYPKAFDNELINDNRYSLLFEWVSPLNRIVLYYPEPDMYLIGCIDHSDYSMMTQSELDKVAATYNLKRPKYFNFGSIKEMLEAVDQFKGVEGVCVYCNHDQDIRKVKSVDYLAKHKLKSELGSFEKLVDFFFVGNYQTYQEFYNGVETTVDFETAEQFKGDISRIIDAMKQVNNIVNGMKNFLTKFTGLTRKQMATEILQAYGNTNRSGFVFKLLDNKPLVQDDLKKLLYQVLKK